MSGGALRTILGSLGLRRVPKGAYSVETAPTTTKWKMHRVRDFCGSSGHMLLQIRSITCSKCITPVRGSEAEE